METIVNDKPCRWTPQLLATEVLSADATQFLANLHHHFEPTRQALLKLRGDRQRMYKKGRFPKFLDETKTLRDSEWQAQPAPVSLQKRWVEITGPAEPKMIINALNSGADVFMADIEDALSPTWQKVLEAQVALSEAYRKSLSLTSGDKTYSLNPNIAQLLVRPRGWHLDEPDFQVSGQVMSASLFDFGLLAFRNAKYCADNNLPFALYLPKIENHLEAQLWDRVLQFTELHLGLAKGFIRCTVLIETISAAFEMDEIIFELRDRILGLNAGRWDYIFSAIKNFHHHPRMILPDRAHVKMTVPFMAAYCRELVRVCHRRGIHAMGGMSAFIPNRNEPETTKNALAQVQSDKERELQLGFDGTWVAHPDLIPLVKGLFAKHLQNQDNQISKTPVTSDFVREEDLLALGETPGEITLAGVLANIEVSLIYLATWLNGQGAVAIHNLMEDVATAEICRSQLWQWAEHGLTTTTGEPITRVALCEWIDGFAFKHQSLPAKHQQDAKELLKGLITAPEFIPFLTQPALAVLRK